MRKSFTKGSKLADPLKDTEVVRRTLERAVASVCPRWLAEYREDIVQTAMLKVLQATNQKDEQNRALAGSYLWKVAYSATADEIRRRRRAETPMDEPALEQHSAAATDNPHRNSAARELGASIRDCLLQVAEPRQVVVQFHLLGHSLGEIERLTAWDAKRVRNLLYRGMANLRDCLSRKGYVA